MTRNGIGFHVVEPFQHSILYPIYARLRDEFPCLIADSARKMIDFRPRIIVVATDYYHPFRECLPGTAIVWTRHGFSSKNNPKHTILGCDFACVSSEWVRDDFMRRGWEPRVGFWVTGFVPMDSVLNPRLSPAARFDWSKPAVLFAPTWNKNLNAIETLGSGWIEAVRQALPHLTIIIKPHPRTYETQVELIRMWRNLARCDPNVHLVEPPDSSVFELLPYADILLTDVSSVMFYFLALNRPMILVNNPNCQTDRRYFDPDGPEWRWRDMGIQIESAEELPSAIHRCLERRDGKADQRALYRKRVFGEILDGCAADRVAGRLRALLRPSAEDKNWVDLSWDRITAMGRLDSALQNRPRMLLHRCSWRLLDRYPRLRSALRRSILQRPSLQSGLHRLSGYLAGSAARAGSHSGHAKAPQNPTGENHRHD
jgi:hypothetical protein